MRRRNRERAAAESPADRDSNGDKDPSITKKLADARLLDVQFNTMVNVSDRTAAEDNGEVPSYEKEHIFWQQQQDKNYNSK